MRGRIVTQRIHAMPFGAEITDKGTRFALFAPTAGDVFLILDGSELPMPDAGGGWRRLVTTKARAGSRYAFKIGGGAVVPDPASRFQPDDVHGASIVVDPGAFEWSDAAWTGRPWEEAVIYEAHVGTVTPEGTNAALADKLDRLKALGITALELMPLADFAGERNWGYDGVLPFAPDSAYGTPDDLKSLIDRAHALGLMVYLDVVYNHFGPAGNYLGTYAGSFFTDRHQTPWGPGINVDGEGAEPVREFFIHNALYWLEEYHFDGLRFDAVHAILDDGERHIVSEIAERVRTDLPGRHIHLVLENDANEARWLKRSDHGRPALHTAQWNDDVHHCWHVLLTGEADGYYEDYADRPHAWLGRCLAEGFAYQGEPSAHRHGTARGTPSADLPPSAFVGFLQNHDQIGNRAFGERLSELVAPERLALARAGLLLSPQIPMLYMGEEWAASTPFLYFVDFSSDEGLARAVREGRSQEFSNFDSFGRGGSGSREIPDPNLAETFARSRLDWREAEDPAHAAVLGETRSLLAIRRAAVVPLLRTPFRGAVYTAAASGTLDVVWRFDGGALRFLANFGSDDAMMPGAPGFKLVWASPATELARGRIRVPPWSGAFMKDDPR
jgi:maltooligosyltrehalose trehalohydrolase